MRWAWGRKGEGIWGEKSKGFGTQNPGFIMTLHTNQIPNLMGSGEIFWRIPGPKLGGLWVPIWWELRARKIFFWETGYPISWDLRARKRFFL